MCLVLLLVLQAAPFEFPGGSASSFAVVLAKHTELSVLKVVEERAIGKISVPWPTDSQKLPLPLLDGLPIQTERIALRAGYDSKLDGFLSLRPIAMPWYRFPITSSQRNVASEFPADPDLIAVKRGMVTTHASKTAFFLPAHLVFLDFTKRVSVHRFFQQTPLTFSEGSWTEGKFLEALREALGATVKTTDEAVFFDVDMKVFRSQMIARFERDSTNAKTDVARARAEFQAEVVRIAPEAKLRSMIEMENAMDVFPLGLTSKAQKLAQEYTRLYLAETEKKEGRDPSVRNEVANLIRSNGNFNRAFRATLFTNGSVEAMIMFGTDAGGTSY